MRIMAIDYGRSRVGLAITDALGVIAQPFMTINVKSQPELITRLKSLIHENGIGLILVGKPLSHTGQKTDMAAEIQRFASQLERSAGIAVQYWDERFTTRYAANILKEQKLSSRKKGLDQIAASVMLEEYLRSCARNRS